MVGHVVLALHIVHSLETNRAGSISRQLLLLSEHILFTLKEKEFEIYLYSTVRAWIMLICVPSSGAMPGWSAVCDYGIS